ncbi:hypothetical protein AURDEDRAFT_131186 [Auricularia subglabra TFB-10046 SS5]|uniref:F-box domain-containing protein n=1 Tax=Auricularia subglabra (strain TFB-10046 / SS5) TaxID=717982 RepID=J0WPP2_AURST|nr:hypothetical protein AURDEDRAFT_131186 [Auricularia subglabra TFB-10046 SS5]
MTSLGQDGVTTPALARMPEDVLRAFFDFLELYDQLRLMSVDHRYRRVGMAHPFYWQYLGLNAENLSGIALEGATCLFLVRLDLSQTRPVVISLHGCDPRSILQHIVGHFSHIRSLTISGVDAAHGQEILDTFDKPAPVLRKLVLQFDGQSAAPATCPIIAPATFATSAPSLRQLSLLNVMLSNPVPDAFSNLSVFSITIRVGIRQPLPFIATDRMEKFSVSGRLWFSPEYYALNVWRNVKSLSILTDGPLSDAYPWDAWRRIPMLTVGYASLERSLALVDDMPGSLRLEGRRDASTARGAFNIATRQPARGAPLNRMLGGAIPASLHEPGLARASTMFSTINARAERFVEFNLALADWDCLVSLIPRLPALADLHLKLDDTASFAGQSAALCCPAIQRLILRAKEGHNPRPVVLGDLEKFVDAALSGATESMKILSLERVTFVPDSPAGACKYIYVPHHIPPD